MSNKVAVLPWRRLVSALLLFLGISSLAIPPKVLAQSPSSGIIAGDPIAASYAKEMSVSYEEAVRRLLLQDEMSRFIEKIARAEPNFAGGWIEHTPEFRVVIALAQSNAREAIQPYLEGVTWADSVGVIVAGKTLQQLEAELSAFRLALVESQAFQDLKVGIGLGIASAKIQLFTLDTEMVKNRLLESGVLAATGSSVENFEFVSLDPPTAPAQWKYPYLNGGTSLTTCTMGYVVRRLSDNRRFVSTAGHCGNTQAVDFAGSSNEDTSVGPI